MRTSTQQLSRLALMTAVICIAAPLQIPVGTVPVTLQTFVVALTGALLGARHGTLAVLAYLLIGAVGLPVFSGWTGGFGVLLGPTGGFLMGFLPLAALCGAGKGKPQPTRLLLGLTGLVLMEISGTLVLMGAAGLSFPAALAAGVWPFLIKDIACIILAIPAARSLTKRLRI